MALTDMSFPSSIVWRLLSTSKDMLASHADPFPHAMWRSSLAVFACDPDPADYPEDADEFKNRQLTFLKVVASITSYTPSCEGCPPPPTHTGEDYESLRLAEEAWKKADELCHEMLHQAYPCAGALVQVAIYPKTGDTDDVNALAYFAAFEPKKRELIEVATESGESLTQSKSDINVKKGLTSTQSTEDLDVFTGMNVSAGAGGASAGFGISGQWGTIKRSGTQQEDVTHTDSSRELRESASHTTTLSQLYHLLNSYHLGTNRAIFFLQPRPHTLQQKDQFTFIDGPQEIEGIQEFFLVVSRPKDIPIDDYCVDALLYTGHLDIIAMRNAINEPKTAETPWIDLWTVKSPLPHDDRPWWDPWKLAEDLLGTAIDLTTEMVNTLAGWVGLSSSGRLPDGVTILVPATVDAFIPPVVLNHPHGPNSALWYTDLPLATAGDNGWRVDRTRGLGGYDLWEDPSNRSADFRGKFDDGKTPKAQAFIDIVPSGAPDDLHTYNPDYALHVRATAYPWAAGDGQATYHCRIKGYFARNDLPTQQRTVKMFVTARGVSNCPESLFADLEPERAVVVLPGEVPDIVADAEVHPPSITPWDPLTSKTQTAAAAQSASPNEESALVPASYPGPVLASNPSGLSHGAVGAARAKMANATSGLVRAQLVASLRCLPPRKKPTRYRFHQTDLYADRMLRAHLNVELTRLADLREPILGLNKFVLQSRSASAVLGRGNAALRKLQGIFATPEPMPTPPPPRKRDADCPPEPGATATPAYPEKPRLDSVKTEVAPSKQFPLLTLHSSRAPAEARSQLARAGIFSGLDLLGVPAEQLARRTGMSVEDVRQLRLQLLGFPAKDRSTPEHDE